MGLVDKIAADIKQAMLNHDTSKLDVLKMLKTALQYEAIKQPGKTLNEDQVIAVLQRERKKRVEASHMYEQNGEMEKASQETKEAEIISAYLPEQLSDDELTKLVEITIADLGADSMKDMGRVMAAVKAKSQNRADGSKVAGLVKEKLGETQQ